MTGGTGVVLVVEDDELVRDSLVDWLELDGHSVHVAQDGVAALSALRGGLRPDLILLDLMMPVMNGWEFRRAQLADPALAPIPTVILSAAGDLEGEALAMRVAGHLHKPCDTTDLLATVKRHLRAA